MSPLTKRPPRDDLKHAKYQVYLIGSNLTHLGSFTRANRTNHIYQRPLCGKSLSGLAILVDNGIP